MFINPISDYGNYMDHIKGKPIRENRREKSKLQSFIIDEAKEKENWALVRKVNRIINNSFGLFYSGNNHYYYSPLYFSTDCKKVDHLETLSWNFLFYRIWGNFNKDGSEIEVSKKKERQAKKYAELYEQKFNKEVTIKLI